MTTSLPRYGLLSAALVLAASPAAAQGAPWCLSENDSRGAVVCSFHTFEQCLETRSGIGGSCGPNPYPSLGTRYPGGGPTERRKRRR